MKRKRMQELQHETRNLQARYEPEVLQVGGMPSRAAESFLETDRLFGIKKTLLFGPMLPSLYQSGPPFLATVAKSINKHGCASFFTKPFGKNACKHLAWPSAPRLPNYNNYRGLTGRFLRNHSS